MNVRDLLLALIEVRDRTRDVIIQFRDEDGHMHALELVDVAPWNEIPTSLVQLRASFIQ